MFVFNAEAWGFNASPRKASGSLLELAPAAGAAAALLKLLATDTRNDV